MDRLPLEIETHIWNLYYMDKYKSVCDELLWNIKFLKIVDKGTVEAKKILRNYRFGTQIQFEKGYIRDTFQKLNAQLEYVMKVKIFRLIGSNTYKVLSGINFDYPFPENYEHICGYLIYNCNYKAKAINILKDICDQYI